MKEMVYLGGRGKAIVLDDGYYEGVRYLILNLGTHPCCYLGVPLAHPLANQDYMNIPLNVHGGLTFGSAGHTGGDYPVDFFWYGWDYAHAGDYSGWRLPALDHEGKQYTTEELLANVKDAIWDFKRIMRLAEAITNKAKVEVK